MNLESGFSWEVDKYFHYKKMYCCKNCKYDDENMNCTADTIEKREEVSCIVNYYGKKVTI